MADEAAKRLKNLQLNDSLLQQLECPVCLETCKPPIYMCVRGHNVCSSCQATITSCPVCRAAGAPSIRNIFAETMSAQVSVPCKFNNSGCQVEMDLTELEDHYKVCEFRFICMIDNCKWVGQRMELMKHCKENHPRRLSGNPTLRRSFKFSELLTRGSDFWICNLFAFDTELFWFHYRYIHDEANFYFYFVYIGPQEISKCYNFNITVLGNDNKSLTHVGPALGYEEDWRKCDKTFEISLKVARKYFGQSDGWTYKRSIQIATKDEDDMN